MSLFGDVAFSLVILLSETSYYPSLYLLYWMVLIRDAIGGVIGLTEE